MKKLLCLLLPILTAILFCGCEISNAEIASSLEGNMTRLIYQVGYLDSIPSAELENLVSSNNYFSGYRNRLSSTSVAENGVNSAGTLGYSNYSNSFRSNVYNSGFDTTTNTTDIDLNSNPLETVSIDVAESADVVSENEQSATADNDVSDVVNWVDISLIESSQADLNDILLQLSQKRGIIMLYCTDLRGGNLDLLNEDKQAISEYITILKETTNYLSSSTGLLTSHYNNIVEIAQVENNQELINAKLIRASELLKTRYAKLDTCIDSMDAIIAILRNYVGFDYNTLQNQSMTNNLPLNYDNSNIAEDLADTSITSDPQNTTDNVVPEINLPETVPNNNCQNQNSSCLDTNTVNNDCCGNTTVNTTNSNGSCLNNNQSNVPYADQNNTIINNNYSGSTPQNNNVAGGTASNTLTPANTNRTLNTEQITPLPATNSTVSTDANNAANNPENITPLVDDQDTSEEVVEDTSPVSPANQILDEENNINGLSDTEVVLNGGFVRNNTDSLTPSSNNYPSTGFQRVNDNGYPANNYYYDDTNNGLDTTFNNPASSPNPINSGRMVSSILTVDKGTKNASVESLSPTTSENTRHMIDIIENPQKMDFPEPIEQDIRPLPEVVLDNTQQRPEIILPSGQSSQEPSLVPLDNRNYAELGMISLFSPSDYPDIPLRTLPLV